MKKIKSILALMFIVLFSCNFLVACKKDVSTNKDNSATISQEAIKERFDEAYNMIISSKKYIQTFEYTGSDIYNSYTTTKVITNLSDNETKIYVTAAGLAAALPGVVASQVKEPVIGVPICVGTLNGIDALLAILQMPKGVPIATMGLGKQGMINAALLCGRILNK